MGLLLFLKYSGCFFWRGLDLVSQILGLLLFLTYSSPSGGSLLFFNTASR